VNCRLDLFLEAVIEVVMDLLYQFLVIEGVQVKFTIIAHQLSPEDKSLKDHNRPGRETPFASGRPPHAGKRRLRQAESPVNGCFPLFEPDFSP
jgi:hypothetical protein